MGMTGRFSLFHWDRDEYVWLYRMDSKRGANGIEVVRDTDLGTNSDRVC
jgi:hypothetical protein